MVLIIMVALCLGLVACDVSPDEPSLTVKLNKNELQLTVGQSETLVATISVEGLSVAWSSTNDAVATVSKGKVQAVGEGSADIVVKVGTAQAVCTVTVVKEKPTIEPTITVEEGYESLIVFYGNQPTDWVYGCSFSNDAYFGSCVWRRNECRKCAVACRRP